MLPKRNRAAPLALAWGALILIAGCSTGTDGEMTESAAAPANEKTAASSASSTPATESSAEPATAALTLFYVAVGDEGKSGQKIGCGDSMVSTETGPEEFTNQVEAAITVLLADDKEELGGSGLRNALAGSDLSYASSVVDGDVVTVELNGTVSSGGTCDDPRIIGQLKYTAMTAAGTGEAEILLEGEKIEKVLSAK